MPTRSRQIRDAAGRPPTAAELARRQQILDATITVIARAGWVGCTLQSVADEIGITKAAVIYHVGTKQDLVRQAYNAVMHQFTDYLQSQLEGAVDATDALHQFVGSQIRYLRDHPSHARVITEAIIAGPAVGVDDTPQSPERTAVLVTLIHAARTEAPERIDDDTLAVLLAGTIDAAVQAWLENPSFNLDDAVHGIGAFLRSTL